MMNMKLPEVVTPPSIYQKLPKEWVIYTPEMKISTSSATLNNEKILPMWN